MAEAAAGAGAAWEILIERFGGLVVAIARRCRLSDADVAEVCQTTWLRLVENVDRIEQPERLGAWLATTSRRESLRIATRRVVLSATDEVYMMADDHVDPLDAGLLKNEQLSMIRMATERLAPRCQRLLGLLMADDDLPYKEIAEQLSMPIGSIGPTRGRCWNTSDRSSLRPTSPRRLSEPRAYHSGRSPLALGGYISHVRSVE